MKQLIIILFLIFSMNIYSNEIKNKKTKVKSNKNNLEIFKKKYIDKKKIEISKKELEKKNLEKEIDVIISKMTLKEKIGQLFNVAIVGKELKPGYKKLIEEYSIGGFTLFNYNIKSRKQIKNFIKELQDTSRIPLFISVDQEGGRITRYTHGRFQPPSPYLLGYLNDSKITKQVAKYVALDLKSVGINLNLAPLADILTDVKNHAIFDRSFSSKRDIVTKQVLTYINSLQGNGVIATAKHFPGQGSLKQDTHKTLPISNISKKLIYERELVPFKKAIDKNLFAIMTSHVIFGALDPKLPATLSKIILTDILRKELDYKGLIFTDGLEMMAILKTFGLKTAVILSLKNGVDLITLNWSLKEIKRAINYAYDAVKNKEISIKEIDKKLKRILLVKKKFIYNKNGGCFCEKSKNINKFLNNIYKKAILYNKVSKKDLKSKKIYTNIRNFKNKNVRYHKHISKDLKDSIIIVKSYYSISRSLRKNNIIIVLSPSIGLSKKYKIIILHDYNKYTKDLVLNLLGI